MTLGVNGDGSKCYAVFCAFRENQFFGHLAERTWFSLTFAKKAKSMRTKYYIEIGGIKQEIPQRCIKNWDEVKCAYKRTDFSGIVRSFTSQFEFVDEVYNMLRDLYLRDGFNAVAILYLYTITDRWEWVERFSAPIDFTSLIWDGNILKVNCIDNSLAAYIKANKSTKYEFIIGEELKYDNTLSFDRVPMLESLTYEFTQGTQYEDCADLLVSIRRGENPFLGIIAEEISINRVIEWNDDQTDDADSYLFKAVADIDVTLDFEISWRCDVGKMGTNIGIKVKRNGIDVPVVSDPDNSRVPTSLAYPGLKGLEYVGIFNNSEELTSEYPHPTEKQWAKIDGKVWYTVYDGMSWHWSSSDKTPAEFYTERSSGKRILSLRMGDVVYIDASDHDAEFRIVTSKFCFSWITRGKKVDIPVLTPDVLCGELLRRIVNDEIKLNVVISDFDSRLANTRLIAAECARGINGAKLYTSFNDFSEWMSVVFGYVYRIGSVNPPQFMHIQTCGGYETGEYKYQQGTYYGDIDVDNIFYNPQISCFIYKDADTGNRYYHWLGNDAYNDRYLKPRTDTLYIIKQISTTTKFCFEEYSGIPLYPKPVAFDEKDLGKDTQTVYFVHRSELFDSISGIRKVEHVRDVKYTIDTSIIYSSVEVGYEKKDYENINGRDEFNFSNSYVTGLLVANKKLTLKSKYRSDCYGLEFAVQKRGADTTDDSSDSDIFFVHVKIENGVMVPDRTVKIENALTDAVFNGAFSPIACIKANAGIIGLQSETLKLKFASSDGNSEIIIDGMPLSSDVVVDTPLMTCGTVEFTTDDTDDPEVFDSLVEIVDNGVVYRGFVDEATFKYAKNEAVKYKLLIKDIEQ